MRWLLLAAEAAAEESWLQKAIVPVLGALGMIIVGLITQLGTFRTSQKNAQAQRDHQLDERADRQYLAMNAEVQRLLALVQAREQEREQARTERDEYRERWAKLRLNVFAAGFDPETIGDQGGGSGAKQQA